MNNLKIMAKDTHGEAYIYGDIGGGYFGGISASEFRTELATIGGVETMDVHINSMGGDYFDGLAIMNQLKSHPATVHIVVDGIAASAASIIAMAGDTIEMRQGAEMMIHDPYTITLGGAADLRKTADKLEMTASEMAKIYAQRSGKSVTETAAIMAAETYFNAEDAVANGFATSTTNAPAIAAHGGEWRAHIPGHPKPKAEPQPPAPETVVETPNLDAARKALDDARKHEG